MRSRTLKLPLPRILSALVGRLPVTAWVWAGRPAEAIDENA